MPADLELLQKRLNYRFTHPDLAIQAITHRSADRINNERLEFLGDSALGLIISQELFALYPDASEGTLSRMRASLVNRDTLAGIAREIDLGSLLQLGAGERKSGGKLRVSILSDAVEALLGAVLLDSDLIRARELVLHLFAERIQQVHTNDRIKDSKTMLQEMLQARGLPLPDYEVLSVTGEAHDQTFKVHCKIALLDQGEIGKGKTKRLAEQDAAEKTLSKIADL